MKHVLKETLGNQMFTQRLICKFKMYFVLKITIERTPIKKFLYRRNFAIRVKKGDPY